MERIFGGAAMIQVKELINLIRYKLKDNNAITYSDYDIMQGINECIRYINQYYLNTDFLEKIKHYRQDDINAAIDEANKTNDTAVEHVHFRDTGVDLPDDFISLVRIVRQWDGKDLAPCPAIKPPRFDEYKVLGNKIYAGVKDFDMLYVAAIASVTDADGSIELPVTFKDALVKITNMILANNPDTDTMSSAVQDILSSIVPLRRYSNAKKRMPFIC